MRDIRRTAVTELFRILKMTLRVIFIILNNLSLRRNVNLNIRKFTRANKPLFWQKWTADVFSYFRPPCLCPSEGHKHGVSVLSSINLCGTFCQITRVRNAAQTWHLDRCLIYLSSIPCQFLDFIHGMVSIFLFNGVTVKTENINKKSRANYFSILDLSKLTSISFFFNQPYQLACSTSPPPFPGTITTRPLAI